MSTETPAADVAPTHETIEELRSEIEDLRTELTDLRAERGNDERAVGIIATKGTLDMAYPPLILASTAAAFGWDVTTFHTFWGLEILHEDHSKALKLSSVGNPNMPVPNLLAALPGMDALSTWLMNRKIADNDTLLVEDLIAACLDADVEMQACQMTQDLLDYDEADFYEGVTTGVGAATALTTMAEADIQLLV